MAVAPGVFVHQGAVALMSAQNRGAIANVGFIVGERAVAVVDTGGSAAEGRALLAAVRGVSDLPVAYVVNTHMHPDHVFGNMAFRGSGPEGGDPAFVGHADLSRALSSRAEHYLAANASLLGNDLAGEIEIVLPDLAVEDRLTLDLGGREIELRAWPTAHTDNDLTVLDVRTGTLFAGDLLFQRHLPVIDGSLLGWLAIQDELAGLPARQVVPGHGPAASPWPDALAPQLAYLEGLAEELRAAIADGAGMAGAVGGIGPPAGGWALVEEFHRRNTTAAFAELEWE
ncbi:Zn-dependent hydrolase, including glyoxylase [Lutibaculum baratangense AMV1]|uniref:Zn-dependent hydrolase, including glyoxylase n=1 Tax=Lutibaculum baratangense AMV1 TaxID=631454 RepID=V4RKE5_9HYPH|nr:Zn-dependent hydrolase, including glyoxylase [Lutibaculum baratangense AMV1]